MGLGRNRPPRNCTHGTVSGASHVSALVGEGLAHVGKLVYLGEAKLAAEPRFFGGNSVFRCADVMRSYQIPPEVIERLREHPGPVLLVSDIVDSRWSITVLAQRLRAGGASAVYPFALGVTH